HPEVREIDRLRGLDLGSEPARRPEVRERGAIALAQRERHADETAHQRAEVPARGIGAERERGHRRCAHHHPEAARAPLARRPAGPPAPPRARGPAASAAPCVCLQSATAATSTPAAAAERARSGLFAAKAAAKVPSEKASGV